jgi:hypothetical protein
MRRGFTVRFITFFLLSCSACFMGLGKSLIVHATLPAVVSVSPSSVTSSVSQNFTINVNVSGVSDPYGLYGWEFILTWNSTLLDAVNVTEGPFLKAATSTFFTSAVNATDGSVKVDCTLTGNVNGVTGDGTLASITFYVYNSGGCPLHLAETILVNSQGQPIQTQAPVDSYGYFTVASDVAIPGDLNGDFKVNLEDLVLLAQAYGSKPGDPNWNPNADIDNNGVVGLSDLVILALHYGQHYP